MTSSRTTGHRVAVTGLGVVSPVSSGTERFWAAVRAGRVGTDEITLFDTSHCLTHRGGEIRGWTRPDYEAPYAPLTRTESFALAATRMALDQGGLLQDGGQSRVSEVYDPARVGAAFGIVLGNRPGMEAPVRALHTVGAHPGEVRAQPPDPVSKVTAHDPSRVSVLPAEMFGLWGPNLVLPTACAAGNSAIAQSADAIAEGRADAMVAGGADELTELMFLMFTSFRALAAEAVRPFDAHRSGLMLGEGSAVLLLEAEEHARSRGAPIHAVVAGHGSYSDAYHTTAPHPGGLGAIRSMRAALRTAELSPADVDCVSAHGTGTPRNDAVEAKALHEVFGHRTDAVPVTALKSMLGHAQGAAGAIAAVGCVLAIRDGVIPPIAQVRTPDPECGLDLVLADARHTPVRHVLNNAFGFGGNNCCTVFSAPEPP